jgi:RNA polymerase sigma factor (sigma-70 family)
MEEKQLSNLFRQALPRMRAFFHKLLKGRIPLDQMSDAKTELVTNTSVKVISALKKGKLDQGFDFSLLVTLCMKDIWRDYVRKRIKVMEKPPDRQLEEAMELPSERNFLNRYEASDRVQQLLKQMRPKDRAIIQMQLEGLNIKEIASAEHTSYDAMKMRMTRLRSWMRDHLS